KADLHATIAKALLDRVVLLYSAWLPYTLIAGTALVAGLLSVLWPVRKIGKLTPMDAMREKD
ncbi:MAG: hypothetical protein LBC13_00530, partial [Clostridiales bacterium]|nr:hypothetical protein [Clostridiales bacterium]